MKRQITQARKLLRVLSKGSLRVVPFQEWLDTNEDMSDAYLGDATKLNRADFYCYEFSPYDKEDEAGLTMFAINPFVFINIIYRWYEEN